jgi:two-component system phosphate regulon sensor histidine kinase PhoR
MAIDTDPGPAPGALMRRLTRGRLVLFAALVVFAALVISGTLTMAQGLVALLIVAGAALLGGTRDSDTTAIGPAHEIGVTAAGDRVMGAVIGAVPDAVIVVDRQGTVVSFNPHAQAIAPAIAVGQPLSFALRVPDLIDAIRRTAASGDSERVEFFERIPSDRWSEAFVAPLALPADASRNRDLLMVTLHDLTPIHRVEEMRVDFVANASHELRTPLASLAGFIDTLQGSARDDAAARTRFLDIMKAQATRMARLIDDLLSLSRIELKAHLQPQTQIDLVSVVRHVADGLQVLARDRGVTIDIDMPAALPIRGDRDELIRVFENLIENALKYGATGKRVAVSGRQEATSGGSEAVIAVRDFGPGIAPEHLPRLTERFYRVDVVESRAQGGTGLGLALVKHILNRHRARLSIDSTPGQGATFSARFPLVTHPNS